MVRPNARTSGSDAGARDPLGLFGPAREFIGNFLRESDLDGIVERATDIEVRDRAEMFGIRVADESWRVPALRSILMPIPGYLLRVGGPLLAGYIMDHVLRDLDRPEEWVKEFTQGFARRVIELKATASGSATAGTGNEADKSKGPAGPPEMSAAEVLVKRPALVQYIERVYAADPVRAAAVMEELRANLNYLHEADMLLIPTTDSATVPAVVTADASWQDLLSDVARLIAPADVPGVLAEIGKRVETVEHVTQLRTPLTVGLTAAVLRTRILALPERQIAPVPREVFERRLELIKDSRADRLLGGKFKGAVDRFDAVSRKIFGGSQPIERRIADGTTFFNGIATAIGGRRR